MNLSESCTELSQFVSSTVSPELVVPVERPLLMVVRPLLRVSPLLRPLLRVSPLLRPLLRVRLLLSPLLRRVLVPDKPMLLLRRVLVERPPLV